MGSQCLLLLHGRVVAMELREVNVRQSFSALRALMARALGLQDCDSCSERQHVLKTKLQGTIEESSYCLLNDLFLVEVRARGLSGPGEGLLLSFAGSDVAWARCLSSGVGVVGVIAHISQCRAQGSPRLWGVCVPRCPRQCPVPCSAPWKWHWREAVSELVLRSPLREWCAPASPRFPQPEKQLFSPPPQKPQLCQRPSAEGLSFGLQEKSPLGLPAPLLGRGKVLWPAEAVRGGWVCRGWSDVSP